MTRIWAVHLAVLAALLAAGYLLPAYHATNLARIMVLATFATGYNLAFGYTGLLSLGHALFFAAGMYAAGLPAWHWGLSAAPALLVGTLAGGAMAFLAGLLALRTAGVSFMIVTLMFAQAFALTILYFNSYTGGDEGFVIPDASRILFGADLSQDLPRYVTAWAIFAIGLIAALVIVRSRFGRTLVALRENEERARMLGINPYATKLQALVLSGLYAGAGGRPMPSCSAMRAAALPASSIPSCPCFMFFLAARALSLAAFLAPGSCSTSPTSPPPSPMPGCSSSAPRWLRWSCSRRGASLAGSAQDGGGTCHEPSASPGLTRHFGGLRAVDGVDFDLGPGKSTP